MVKIGNGISRSHGRQNSNGLLMAVKWPTLLTWATYGPQMTTYGPQMDHLWPSNGPPMAHLFRLTAELLKLSGFLPCLHGSSVNLKHIWYFCVTSQNANKLKHAFRKLRKNKRIQIFGRIDRSQIYVSPL